MYLSRFAVVGTFAAWSPGDRNCPDRRVSISPGPKDLFIENAEGSGIFVKFLRNGEWFEAARSDFERSTTPMAETHHRAMAS